MSIDSCRNKKPADQCQMAKSLAQTAESWKMAPKETIQVNLGQLSHAAYIFAIWCGKSILLPIDSCQSKVSADHDLIAGSSVELTGGHVLLKVCRWPGCECSLDLRLAVFTNYWNEKKIAKSHSGTYLYTLVPPPGINSSLHSFFIWEYCFSCPGWILLFFCRFQTENILMNILILRIKIFFTV